MKTEIECEAMAKEALQKYVNACEPNSPREAHLATQKMAAMCLHAMGLIENGKQSPVQ